MAREPESYRATLELISARCDHLMLTVSEAAKITGYDEKHITEHITWGWTKKCAGKRINVADLARQMCATR